MTIITESINEYIELQLDERSIKLIVNGERFIHCIGLFIHLTRSELKSINSVDEAEETFPSAHPPDFEISPEAQFLGHCRNLKKWADSGYDSRLVHSNLSFPLLKKLSEVGDPMATKVFNEEIVKRFSSGVSSVQVFLLEEGYLNFLKKNEIEVLLNNINNIIEFRGVIIPLYEAIALMDLENLTSSKFAKVDELDFSYEAIEFPCQFIYNEKVKKIEVILLREKISCEECREDIRRNYGPKPTQEECAVCGIYKIPDSIGNFSFLRELFVFSDKYHGFKDLSQTIFKIKSLEKLVLAGNRISNIPDSIANCKKLRYLEVYSTKLKTIPESIGNLSNLSTIKFRACELKEIPESIINLSELTIIDLSSNRIDRLPGSFGNLCKLEEIYLRDNLLVKIPECFREIEKLRVLDLSYNRIEAIPEWIENMESLKRLDFNGNLVITTEREADVFLSEMFSEIQEKQSKTENK